MSWLHWNSGKDEPTDRKKLLLEYAAETRRFEIERFWQRTLFFWTVLGAAFVAYAVLADKKDEFARTASACFGLMASFAWTLQNRGAKYWQESWEQKTKRHQEAALGTDLFSRHEPRLKKGMFGGWEFSVSRLAIILSDYTTLIWLCLALRPLSPHLEAWLVGYGPCTKHVMLSLRNHAVEMAVLGTLLCCICLIWFGRSGRAGGERADQRND